MLIDIQYYKPGIAKMERKFESRVRFPLKKLIFVNYQSRLLIVLFMHSNFLLLIVWIIQLLICWRLKKIGDEKVFRKKLKSFYARHSCCGGRENPLTQKKNFPLPLFNLNFHFFPCLLFENLIKMFLMWKWIDKRCEGWDGNENESFIIFEVYLGSDG